MLLQDAVYVSTFQKLVSTLTFFCHFLHFKHVRPKQKSNISHKLQITRRD